MALINKIVFGADPGNPAHYHAFEDMRGRLQPKSKQLEVIVRGGHAGESTRDTGTRGVPCQLLTIHFVADWTAAKDAIAAYALLKDGNPYKIFQRSVDYGYWKVLDVADVDARAVVNVVNSLVANPLVLQACQWTVVSTTGP